MVDVAGGAPALVDLSIFDRWEPNEALASGSDNDDGARPAATPENAEPGGAGADDHQPAPDGAPAGPQEEEQEEPDLTRYGPPEALHRLPYTDSETIVTVVRSSIDNVVAQVAAEEEQRRRAREEAERQRAKREAKAAAAATATEGPTPPAVIVTAASSPSPAPEAPLDRHGKFPAKPRAIFRALFRKRIMSDLQDAAGPSGRPAVTDPDRSAVQEAVREAVRQHEQEQEQEQVECISCFDDFWPKDVIKTVCHSYCKDCFQRLIANAIENEAQWPPKCCLNPIPYRTILKHVSADLKRRYEECAEEFSVPVDERVYCARPACGLFIKKSGFRPQEHRARCPAGHWTCTSCRQQAHPDAAECPRNEDLRQVQQLALQEGWQRCYRCRNMVEHTEACQHMTCRCGAQFCYVCGRRWKRCDCTAQQLAEIKGRARHRAELRAAAEESEVRERREEAEALQLVEAFERAQARRRELARQEAERRRAAAVAARYAELRDRLGELNDLQGILLGYQHDRERDLLRARAREAGEALERRQAARRAETDAAGTARMAERDRAWSRDYHLRVALERRLEDDYRARLEAYWGPRPGGDEGARRALRVFQRKNDARFRAWRRRRDGDVERLRWEVEEERAVQGELMEARAARLARSFADQEAELRRKWRAEARWLDLVAAERARMLRELEGAELEAGAAAAADDDFEEWHDLPPEEEAGAVSASWALPLQRQREALA